MKPILACDFDATKVKFPCAVLPKIDGVRGLNLIGQFTGRSLKPHGNKRLDQVFGQQSLQWLDGELIIGDNPADDNELCNRTTSVVNSYEHPDTDNLTWWVFDCCHPDFHKKGFLERYHEAKKAIEYLKLAGFMGKVFLVPCYIVDNIQELDNFHSAFVDEGYEGTIIRSIDGPYKYGRCTAKEFYYTRIKDFIEEDAIVDKIIEAVENTNEATINELGLSERASHQAGKIPKGMVGALDCTDIKTGQPIRVGPGAMKHKDRILYFNNPELLLGKRIKYKHFPKNRKDKPRFPTYVSHRVDSDKEAE